MDPITIMATVTAAFNGIKKAVELGREAQDIFGQLGKWAEGAGQLSAYINANKKTCHFGDSKFFSGVGICFGKLIRSTYNSSIVGK